MNSDAPELQTQASNDGDFSSSSKSVLKQAPAHDLHNWDLKRVAWLVGHIAVPVIGGSLGGIVTAPAVKGDWYARLHRPSFSPPSFLFGPVWTSLYTLMGIASFLIWSQGGFRKQALPLGLYGFNLLLNFSWTPMFFGKRRLDLAMADITVLWVSILSVIYAYAPVDVRAAACLVPYLGWVSFASALNLAYWTLNTPINTPALVLLLLFSVLGAGAAFLLSQGPQKLRDLASSHPSRLPAWALPVWAFSVAMGSAHFLAGFACYLAIMSGGNFGFALFLFIVFLLLSYAWPVLVFKLQRLDWGLKAVAGLGGMGALLLIVFGVLNGAAAVCFLLPFAFTVFLGAMVYHLKRSGSSSSSLDVEGQKIDGVALISSSPSV